MISIVLSGMTLRRTLRWTLRSTVSPHPASTQQGGDHRTVTIVTGTKLPLAAAEALLDGIEDHFDAIRVAFARSRDVLQGAIDQIEQAAGPIVEAA